MHFAVADLRKWRSVDGRNHWIACEPRDPWSPRGVSMGVKHEAAYCAMLQILTLQIKIPLTITSHIILTLTDCHR